MITNGTIVMRNGVIEDIGANVTAPPDAMVIDASGLHMYPGLIDMANAAPLEGEAQAPAVGGGGGRGGGAGSDSHSGRGFSVTSAAPDSHGGE